MNATSAKELDESIYDLLDAIRKKPGLFVVEPSIFRLQAFVNGHSSGLGRVGFTLRDGEKFFKFNDWVARHFGFSESTSGWCNMIREKSTSDADAFKQFFILLDEFRKEKA
jgi:hypothetical protein